MYVPLQVNTFQKSILLMVQYKYLKSYSGDFYSPESDPPHKIMRYWFYYSIYLCFSFPTMVLHLRLSTSGTWQVNLTSCACQVDLSPPPPANLQITWQVTACQVNLSSQLEWWPPWNHTRKLSQDPPQSGTAGGIRPRSWPKKKSKSITF